MIGWISSVVAVAKTTSLMNRPPTNQPHAAINHSHRVSAQTDDLGDQAESE